MNEEIEKIKNDISKKYCELIQMNTDVNKNVNEKYCELMNMNKEIHITISNVLDLISLMEKEMKSIRTDLNKLIENNNGGVCYGRTA